MTKDTIGETEEDLQKEKKDYRNDALKNYKLIKEPNTEIENMYKEIVDM